MNRTYTVALLAMLALLVLLLLLRAAVIRRPAIVGKGTFALGTAVVGQPLKWRVLDTGHLLPSKLPLPPGAVGSAIGEHFSGTMGGLVAGNFDSDPDEEVVLIGMKSSRLYEADGSSRPVKLHGQGFFMTLTAWDWDGDGIDEIVPEAIQYSVATNYKPGSNTASPGVPTTTPVFKLDKLQHVASLQGIDPLGPLTGDIDGDGFSELALSTSSGYVIHSINGQSTGLASPRPRLIALADPLGQGHASPILGENRNRDLMLLDAQGKKQKLGSVGFVALHSFPADLDGDRHDELLFGASGYFSASKGFVPFQYQSSSMPQTCKARAVDSMGLGTKQVVVLRGANIPINDEFVVYDQLGKVVHHERVNTGPQGLNGLWELAAIRSGGRDYLCLQLSDKLLIYP